MTQRRPMGALEDGVMAYLWVTDGLVTPAEVHQAVAPDLAYTTVMTVLSRLWSKGRLDRERVGRGFGYSPVQTEAEHHADLMQSTLESSGDPDAVLSSFVASLSHHDMSRLRHLLGGSGG